ncbi:MAG: vitamin K epoxide reductase family protein [Acidimicrobiales bacterium]
MAAAVVARLRDVLTDGSEITYSAPQWRSALALFLSLAGLGVSVYLTVDHFAKVRLVCADSGVVNCQKVTTSAQSHFLGIPVAVLGLAFFLAMTALNLPAAWRAADRRVHLARLVLAVAGIAFVLYLVAAELLIIGNICLWCTTVHVITFVLLVLLVATIPTMLGWGVVATPVPARSQGRGSRSAHR